MHDTLLTKQLAMHHPQLRCLATLSQGVPSCSGRAASWPSAPRLPRLVAPGRHAWAPSRRRELPRAEFGRDPRGGGGGGPATQQQQQQQPWGTDGYQYAPQPTSVPPPRMPPLDSGGPGSDDGGGGGGLSNLQKAFIAGAFILGGYGWGGGAWRGGQ